MQNALVIVPMHNTPGINPRTGIAWADATGAFQPEARLFLKRHALHAPIFQFDNRKNIADRFADLRTALRVVGSSLDTLVVFCHGWHEGLQCGVTLANLDLFIRECVQALSKECLIILYACSTGADRLATTSNIAKGPGGDGGLADQMRDKGARAGLRMRVIAHPTPGHCTKNPRVRDFTPGEQVGGQWVVEPDSGLYQKWDLALDKTPSDKMPVRFGYPFWNREQLEIELARY